jgi:hypothetical protein
MKNILTKNLRCLRQNGVGTVFFQGRRHSAEGTHLYHIKGVLKMIKIIAGALILGLLFLQAPSAARKSR